MAKFSLNLPNKKRLDIRITKRRGDSLVKSSLNVLKNMRSGNKLSRLARHVIDSVNVKKFLGTNLAMLTIATSFLPGANIASTEPENVTVQAQTELTTTRVVRYPIDTIAVTQGYTYGHPGVDFDGITGEYVWPIAKGRIEAVQHSRFAYGNAVYINHGNGTTSLYAHLSKIYVEEGDEVDTWDKIGEVGSTGRSSGDHLHLEVRVNERPINPYSVLPR